MQSQPPSNEQAPPSATAAPTPADAKENGARQRRPLVALILGGTATVALPLASALLKQGAQFVRIADRFAVNPPTCYIDEQFKVLLRDPRVEYRQANLAIADRYPAVFTPPDEGTQWKRFDAVFDLTGEMAFDRVEVFHITNTYSTALSLATYASKLDPEKRPLAYVRLQMPFYEMKAGSSGGHSESDRLRPDGVRGQWWHEALRGIARLPDLNFGIVRCAAWYGPGRCDEEVIARLVVGHVYKYLKEEMKFLYNADLPVNTVHANDVGRALYLTAQWLMHTPREQVLREAGAPLYFGFGEAKEKKSLFSRGSSRKGSTTQGEEEWRKVTTVVPEDVVPVAPMFNVVDDAKSTQDSLGRAVAEVWGIKYGFLRSTIMALVTTFDKADFNEMVEDINEKHVNAWGEMLAKSTPPITATPISPFMDAHSFRKLPIHLDGSRAQRVLGFKPTRPRVDVAELRSIVQGFQKDHVWPTLAD